MHGVLEQEYSISAEQAFGIYDLHDDGECSVEEFKRVLRIFFGEVIPKEEDREFLMRLTQKRGDSKIAYREFCKFLSKRVVRTFRVAAGEPGAEGGPAGEGAEALGALQREL